MLSVYSDNPQLSFLLRKNPHGAGGLVERSINGDSTIQGHNRLCGGGSREVWLEDKTL